MLGQFSYNLLKPKHWPAWFLLLLLWLFSYTPLNIKQRLLSWVGNRSFEGNERRQTAVHANLNLCYPQLTIAEKQVIVDDYKRYAAWALGDMAWMWFRSLKQIRKRTRIIGAEHLEIAKQQPVIFLCPHVLWLEYGAFSVGQEVRLAAIFNSFTHPLLDWLVGRKRAQLKPITIRRQSGKTIDQLIDAVNQGFSIYHLADEDLGADRSVFAPFFNVSKATVASMGKLVDSTQTLVIPCCPIYNPENGKVDVHLSAPLDLRTEANDAVKTASSINQAYEAMIRRCPEQYMWNLLYFKSSPPDAPRDVYGDYVALKEPTKH